MTDAEKLTCIKHNVMASSMATMFIEKHTKTIWTQKVC